MIEVVYLRGFAHINEPKQVYPLEGVADWLQAWARQWGFGHELIHTHPNGAEVRYRTIRHDAATQP
jgi:hypothetical protein